MTRTLGAISAAVGLGIGLLASSSVPEAPRKEAAVEYLEVVDRLVANGPPFEEGSDEEQAALDAFRTALSDFKSPEFLDRIRAVYAEELFFNDTLKTIRSNDDLVEYFRESADALDSGTVEFLDVVGNDGNYYLRWRMDLQFERLAGGRTTTSVGMSHVRFDPDGSVVLHQDFWDSAGGLFEYVPAVGWAIRKIRNRL